jgi:hypothetical protein
MEPNKDLGDFQLETVETEKANALLREEMLRFNRNTDKDDRLRLALLLTNPSCKVMVPVRAEDEEQGTPQQYVSMYKRDTTLELHLYTSITLIPDVVQAPHVSIRPMNEVMAEAVDHCGVTLVLLDPGPPHGVGFMVTNGAPRMFRLKAMEDQMLANGEPAWYLDPEHDR